jgi:speckle-type POZ protein
MYGQCKHGLIFQVFSNTEIPPISDTVLKESLMKLRSNPKFSDVTLKINGKTVPAHKCLLAARSGKFKMMFEAQMSENGEHTILIETQKPQLFMSMIDWIYSSELDFPDSTSDIFEMILLADEYLLEDLRRKCEDGLIYRLDQDNALEILVIASKYPTIASDNLIEYAINTLIEDFDVILRKHPKLEDELKSSRGVTIGVPGLVTKILMFIHQRKTKSKRVAFLSRDSSREFLREERNESFLSGS